MTPGRLQRTIQGEETNRRPFIPLLNILGARLTGASIEQYYRDPVRFAAGQREILRRFEPDALFSPLFFAGEGEAWGSSVRFSTGAAPNIRRPAAETPEKSLALPIPDPDTNPLLRYFVEGTRLTREATGSRRARSMTSHPRQASRSGSSARTRNTWKRGSSMRYQHSGRNDA